MARYCQRLIGDSCGDMLQRRLILGTGGSMAKMVLSILEDFKVDNIDILLKYIEHREPDQPLVTVCNHASTFDEPLLWGMLPLRVLWNPSLLRWTLSAEEVCFNNPFTRWFFGSGQGIS